MSIVSDYFSFQNGYAFKSKDFVKNGKYAIIRIKELKDGSVKFSEDTARINPEDGFNINKYIVKKGDVLFALTGDSVNKTNPLSWVGRISYYNYDTPALLNQRVCKAIPKNKVSNEFLYYFFRQNEEFYNLASKATGSASQANISTKTIEQHIMEIPDEDIRKKIVFILLNIDMKIDVNNRINDNVLQQASAIYQAWFEDFVLTDGSCPSTWRQGILADIANITSGKRPPVKSTERTDTAFIPLVGAASVMGFTSEANHTDKVLVTGRVGTHGVVQRFNSPCWTSDNTLVITSDLYEYTYQILQRIDYSSMNRGSTQPLITQGDMNKVSILIPDKEILNDFEILVGQLMEQYQANSLENKKLVELRDTLLPKLMSGELDVSALDL